MKLRHVILILVCCAALIGAGLLWWFAGSKISEETAYKLAVDYAHTYANRNRLNLDLYVKPKVGGQADQQLYTFCWMPKQEGKPLCVSVDAMNVEISVDESS